MFESDAKFADWLDWFTGDREQIASPFYLPDGRRCATDSKIAVVTTDEGHSAIIEGDWYAKIPARIQSFFALPVDNEATVEDMVERFGECEHPIVQKCSTCKGRKTVGHVCGCELCEIESEECQDCDKTSKEHVLPDARHVCVWGAPFDANLIAYAVAHAPKSALYRVRLVTYEGKELKTDRTLKNRFLWITGNGWDAFVVAMNDSVLKEHKCPEVMAEQAANLIPK